MSFKSSTCFKILFVAFFISIELLAQTNIRNVKIRGTSYVFLEDVARFYGMRYKRKGKDIVLYSRFSRLNFKLDKRETTINKVKVNLSFAPDLWKEKDVVISTKDFFLLIDPLFRIKSISRKSIIRIMIDPGHGGKDEGTSGKLYKEKDVTLEVAKRLQTALKKEGYTVAMTRTGDTKPTLDKRCKMAVAWKADLFISLHCNSVGTASVNGTETFIITPYNTPSTYGNSVCEKKHPSHKYDKENTRLGYEMQKNILKYAKTTDRGLKHAQFYVLTKVSCPAVLVEMGFLSNVGEEKKLGTIAHQERLVKGLVSGINAFRKASLHKK